MSGRGTTYFEAYRQGKSLTPRQAILAKCSECTCHYVDGREDCGIPDCTLYPYMPYGNAPRKKIRRVSRRG